MRQARERIGKTASPEQLFEQLAKGNEAGATALLISSYLNSQSLVALFDGAVTSAMHRVGDLWYRGEMTIADEHLATQTAIAALHQLRGVRHLSPPTETMALVCGVEGDLHELPIHLVHVLLEADGWDVINLGPNTSVFYAVQDITQATSAAPLYFWQDHD